jgi:hypothetical protein
VVSWVQDKWDAAGATHACIRVIARRGGGADARLSAFKLLATLLHGESRVPLTMATFLLDHRELCTGFFQARLQRLTYPRSQLSCPPSRNGALCCSTRARPRARG